MSTSDTVFNHPTTEGTLGEGVGLSKSNTSNLKKCYPDSPVYQATPTITIDEDSATLDEANASLSYKQHYYKVCMRGESPSDSFGTQDMSYGTSGLEGYASKPPSYDNIKGQGEDANAGFNGSTISKSGLGPNVSINPAIMVDVRPDAIQPSPETSSTSMAMASTDIPSKFDMGQSPATDAVDSIGTINDGQSSPVAP